MKRGVHDEAGGLCNHRRLAPTMNPRTLSRFWISTVSTSLQAFATVILFGASFILALSACQSALLRAHEGLYMMYAALETRSATRRSCGCA